MNAKKRAVELDVEAAINPLKVYTIVETTGFTVVEYWYTWEYALECAYYLNGPAKALHIVSERESLLVEGV